MFLKSRSKDEMERFEALRTVMHNKHAAVNGNGVVNIQEVGGDAGTVPIETIRTWPVENSSVLRAETTWNGTLTAPTSLQIEGSLTGEAQSGETVVIATGAHVQAKIRAKNVIVDGWLEGDVECSDTFEIGPMGRFVGQVTTGLVVIKPGATFKGRLNMSEDNE